MARLIKPSFITYALLLFAGVFIGWLLFKGSPSEKHSTTNMAHDHEETTWTCSMHPQIKQNEPGNCPICGMELIPATSSSSKGNTDPYMHEMTPEAVALSNIRTLRLGNVATQNEIPLSGTVNIDEQKVASITSNFSGRIERLYIDFTGKTVKEGDRLATLYSPELVTAQKELLEAAKNKESNKMLYNAAKEKLRVLKISESQIEAIENRGEVQTRFDIYAHVSGIVTDKMVSEGDYVTKGSTMFAIADLSKVWVMLDAYENDIAWIAKGNKVSFTVAALPGKEFIAQVDYIDPIVNPTTRTVSVRAEIANPTLSLKPGMFVTAKITPLAVQDNALAIPKTAVLWTGKRSIVYVKLPDKPTPTFEMREVVLGKTLGALYFIESGLDIGEEVVVNGAFTVDASAQLNGKYSMMSRPETNDLAISEQFMNKFTQAIDDYFTLKNAFVASDEKAVKLAAQNLERFISSINKDILAEESQSAWIPLKQSITNALAKIVKSEGIENQRENFEELSKFMITGVELFGVKKEKVYKAYCPMASKDQGAYWLSEKPEIQNPYYGESMLACGEVKEIYRN